MDVHSELIINAPAAEAWRVLGQDFADIGEWAVSIEASHIDTDVVQVGTVRTCAGPAMGPFPAGDFTEELTHFDAANMSFAYVGRSGLPPFIKRARNSWRIEAIDERSCRVMSHAVVELAWWVRPFEWLMFRMMGKSFDGFEDELRHRIEQGSAHPRKVEAIASAGKAVAS